jgi:hypothetical protein
MKLTYENVRSVLSECGPLTMHEVALFFPSVPYCNVGSAISKMRIGVVTKQIYVHSWTREGVGRKYLRAVYALGNKRDARKPPVISDKERCQTWRERKRQAKLLPNQAPTSVFQLAQHL